VALLSAPVPDEQLNALRGAIAWLAADDNAFITIAPMLKRLRALLASLEAREAAEAEATAPFHGIIWSDEARPKFTPLVSAAIRAAVTTAGDPSNLDATYAVTAALRAALPNDPIAYVRTGDYYRLHPLWLELWGDRSG
jgi:hypothetical protein